MTLKEATTGKMYSRATWTNVTLIIFHELTGINAITLYSNEMYKQMGLANPRVGTLFNGGASCIGAVIAVIILNKVGRRPLLISGHFIMTTCHLLLGLFAYWNDGTWVVVWMVSFILAYNITNGPIIWLYVSETVVDTALGLCMFSLWGTVLVLSMTTNFLM